MTNSQASQKPRRRREGRGREECGRKRVKRGGLARSGVPQVVGKSLFYLITGDTGRRVGV